MRDHGTGNSLEPEYSCGVVSASEVDLLLILLLYQDLFGLTSCAQRTNLITHHSPSPSKFYKSILHPLPTSLSPTSRINPQQLLPLIRTQIPI